MSTNEQTSRFRPVYRQLNDEETDVINAIKEQAEVLAALFDLLPDGREKSLSLTKLEEAVMWSVKGVSA